MTGKWAEPGVPHKGWICLGVEDLEDDIEVCEMCEVAEVRYMHQMTHPEYGELHVGCVCAENMAEGYRAREAEMPLRKRATRRQRWLLREWKTSARGNTFLKTRDGFHVVIWRNRDDSWGGRITDLEIERHVTSKQRYESENAAKLAAFAAVEILKQRREKYFR